MAKKTDREKFELEDISNNKKIDSEFERLETFIEEHTDIHDQNRDNVQKMMQAYRGKFSLKGNVVYNTALIESAIGIVNDYIENAYNGTK